MNIDLYIQAARSIIGSPYRWVANGPDMFDCSGAQLYCLRAAGFDLPDMTAHDLAVHFKDKTIGLPDVKPGCLFFFGRPVHHVMGCLTRWPDGHFILFGARGGDETTKDLEIAYLQDAMVDIVNGNYWFTQRSLIVNPFKE